MKDVDITSGYIVEIEDIDEDWFNYLIPASQSMALLAENDFLLDKDMSELLSYDDDDEADDSGFYL